MIQKQEIVLTEKKSYIPISLLATTTKVVKKMFEQKFKTEEIIAWGTSWLQNTAFHHKQTDQIVSELEHDLEFKTYVRLFL